MTSVSFAGFAAAIVHRAYAAAGHDYQDLAESELRDDAPSRGRPNRSGGVQSLLDLIMRHRSREEKALK